MYLTSLIHNEVLQLIIGLAEIGGLIAVIYKLVRNFIWPRVSRGAEASREHFEHIIALSLGNESYLSACVLILLTRVMTSLFFIIVSLFLLFVSISAGRSGSAGLGPNGPGLTGAIMQDLSLLFVALSCALFSGNVVSATNFSRAVRRKIDSTSVKAPFARGFFGLKS